MPDNKTRVLMPAAFMAIAGLMIGAAAGPGIGLAGSIGGLDSSTSESRSAGSVFTKILESNLADAASCPYEDQTKGWGGQAGSCAFECPGPAGTFNLQVQADDKDATVSGTASCGPHDIHCDGQKSCTTTGGYSGTQAGTCSGDSDEFADSGLYINCSANGEDGSVGGGGDPPEQCILTKPIKVCHDPGSTPPRLAAMFGLCARLLCNIDDSELTIADPSGLAGVHLYALDGHGAGAICDDTGACRLVDPLVASIEGRTTIRI